MAKTNTIAMTAAIIGMDSIRPIGDEHVYEELAAHFRLTGCTFEHLRSSVAVTDSSAEGCQTNT